MRLMESIMVMQITVHTSRTIMFAELSKVMDYAVADDRYLEWLNLNVSGKRTKANQDKTTSFLTRLYSFDLSYPPFWAFKHFWSTSQTDEHPINTFVYAFYRDYLLRESAAEVLSIPEGEKSIIFRDGLNDMIVELVKTMVMLHEFDMKVPVDGMQWYLGKREVDGGKVLTFEVWKSGDYSGDLNIPTEMYDHYWAEYEGPDELYRSGMFSVVNQVSMLGIISEMRGAS